MSNPLDFPPVSRPYLPAQLIARPFFEDASANTGARARCLAWPSGWVLLVVIAFVFAVPTGALAAPDSTTVMAAASGDQAATHALLQADYRLAKATLAHTLATEDATARAAQVLGRECRGVLRGAPDE